METKILKPTLNPTPRQKLRDMPEKQWINNHASGTLRKGKQIGMACRSQYLHERCAWEYGWTFELLPSSRIEFGRAISEADNKAITEVGWFVERYLTLNNAIF